MGMHEYFTVYRLREIRCRWLEDEGAKMERNAMKPMREERRKLISTKKEEEEEDGKGVPEIQQTWADYNIIPLFVSEQKKNESTPVVSQKIFKISLSSFFWQKPIFANSKSLFPLLERAPALNFPAPPSVA